MITYKEIKNFVEKDLKDLFLSVGWISANYSDRLVKAIANSDTVFSAWDDETLIGLINVLDDGELTAYAHYLLVRPTFQNKELVPFYEKQGFNVVEGALPMTIFNP